MGLWDGLGSAGLGFLGGLFQGGFNYAAQKQANETNLQITRETNAANRQLAEYEWNKNLEMWNRQNQYNSPAAQMQRYKDAGLNPNLIYGQGSSGNATTLPKYSAPTMQPVTVNPQLMRLDNALNVLGHYMDYRIKSAQEEQIKAQTANINWTRTMLWPAQTGLWSSQSGYWRANADRLTSLLPFEKRNFNSLINTRSDQLSLARLRYDLDRQRFMYGLDLSRDQYQLAKDRFAFDKYVWKDRFQFMKDRFAFDKDVWRDRFGLMKDRLRLDNLNSVYTRAINKKQYEFFRDYGVMPNTLIGSRFGLYNHIYGDDASNQMQRYLDAEIQGMVLNSIPSFDGGFNFRGRRRRFPTIKPVKL